MTNSELLVLYWILSVVPGNHSQGLPFLVFTTPKVCNG